MCKERWKRRGEEEGGGERGDDEMGGQRRGWGSGGGVGEEGVAGGGRRERGVRREVGEAGCEGMASASGVAMDLITGASVPRVAMALVVCSCIACVLVAEEHRKTVLCALLSGL